MPIYCENCKKVWIIARTTFTQGECPYCRGITRPLLPQIKAEETYKDKRGEQ